MQIKHILISAVCLILAILAFFIITNWNKHILYLTTGEIIEAGKTWIVFDDVYYEKGAGTLYTLTTDQVDRIVSANFSCVDDWLIILTNEMNARRGIFDLVFNRMVWLGALFAFGVFISIFLSRSLILRYSEKKQKSDDIEELRFIHI